jgi:fungal STAND N-terminal Goodbye domain
LNHSDGREANRSSSPNVLSTAPLTSAQPLSPNEREQPDLSSTEQATSSTSNVQLIVNALADYSKTTGIDLSKNSFATALEQSNSPEAIFQLLEAREKAFKEYRDGNRRLINCLSPVVKVIQAFSGVLGEAASLVSLVYYPANLLL